MPSRLCGVVDEDDRDAARASYTPTKLTMPDSVGTNAGRGIVPRIARRGVDISEKLGRHQWVVERTHARFNRFRRLPVRYERRADIYEAFTSLAASLIKFKQIKRFC